MYGDLVDALFEQSSAALVLLDATATMTCVRHNEHFQLLMGADPVVPLLIGRSIADLIAPRSMPGFESAWTQAVTSGRVVPLPDELALFTGNGRSQQIGGRLTPLRSHDGRVTAVLMTLLDGRQGGWASTAYDEERRYAEMVGQVTVSLTQPRSSGLVPLLASLIAAAVDVFDAASAAVWLFDDNDKRFHMAYSQGYRETAVAALAIINPQEPLTVVSRAVQHSRVIVLGRDDPDDSADLAAPQSREIMRDTNTALVGATPLIVHGQMVGAMSLALSHLQTSRLLIERVLAGIAPHIAGAIERERLFDQVRRQRDLAQTLARLTEQLNIAATPAAMATAVIAAIRTMLEVRTIVVAETNEGESILHTIEEYGMPREYRTRMDRAPLSTPTVTTWVVQSGQPMEIICDEQGQMNVSDPRFSLTYQMMRDYGVRRFIVLPLRSSLGIFGALSTSMVSLSQLSSEDRGFLHTVADLAGETLARLRLGAEVRERASQMEEIFRHSPVGMALYNCDLCYVLINDALAGLNGLPAADHIGRSVYDVLGQDTVVGTLMQHVVESGVPYHSGALAIHVPRQPDRQPGIYDMHIAPLTALRNGRMETQGVLAFVVDITAEARNARLREDFLSMASHELKTPVTSIGGFAQALLRRAEKDHVSPSVLRAYQVIEHQCRRLSALVNELLEVNRIQAGRLVLHHERCDLALLCQLVIDQIAPTTDRHYLVLQGGCAGADQPMATVCWCDIARIEQVLLNLLDNAIKYSPQGGTVTISVWLGSTAENVHCSVGDEGIGIPAEAIAHLFEPWFRAANANVSSSGGLGMGLYISDQIVQAHGGALSASSTPGKGTTFELSLPIQPVIPPLAQQLASQTPLTIQQEERVS